ncbi:tyrosine-type recombinase/integrase [Bifidobacterium sp. ESL0745]|uniref:tyrosine-type recombinase/integrase n=1 Tax=Bifidobacterium sp. ESL0745 TaxID=2983226 RepID=UPI0023F9E2E8|nr:tyrosine-type recombinase/integrase [Bifidobacterium sp. ESL0745]MDF7665751.1 tyrosine-type recombinase/integrase [Bifidobacterium sp. ESL0745]
MARSATGKYKARKYTDSNGNERWRVRIDIGHYPNGNRKKKTVTAATYRECQAKAEELLNEIKQNGAPLDSRITLGDYADRWLEQKIHEVDPKTYTGYKTIVKYHLNPYRQTPLSKIVPTTINTILNNLQAYDKHGNPKGPASISLKRQTHTCINQIMQAALADRLISVNPVSAVRTPKRKDDTGERTAFSVPEMQAMLRVSANMPIEEGTIWWFRLLTGMRQGEILGATWDDYDARKNEYKVNWKLQEAPRDHGCGLPDANGRYPCGKGKGGLCPKAVWRVPDGYEMRPLTGAFVLSRPKSKTGRIVPIIPPLAEALKRYRKATRTQPNPYGLIFRQPDGSPISGHVDNNRFDDLMLASCIDPTKHTGHETRHSVVTLLASAGVDFQLIEEIVGHSSIAMVEHYRHADDSERMRAMEKMDNKLGLEQIGWKEPS